MAINEKKVALTKRKMIEALERSLGIVTPAAKEVGISRQQFYVYYNTDPEFKKAVDEIDTMTTDFVENQLFKKIKEGSEKSIMFYMKYKGRKRGYDSTIDVNLTGGDASITVIKLTSNKKEDEDGIGD